MSTAHLNEIPGPGFATGAIMRDKEILSSMVGLRQDGGTFAADPTAGPNNDGILPSGQVLAELSDGTLVAYNDHDVPVAADEKQRILVNATGGTFTATVLGKTTAAIDWNASGPAVKAAIVAAIPDATDEDFAVAKTGSGAVDVQVTFKGQYGSKDQPIITTAAGSLTGGAGTAAVTVTTAGSAGAADGSMKAIGVLRRHVNVTVAGALGNIVTGGRLKYDQLVGLTDDAVRDLNGTVNVNRNTFTFNA